MPIARLTSRTPRLPELRRHKSIGRVDEEAQRLWAKWIGAVVSFFLFRVGHQIQTPMSREENRSTLGSGCAVFSIRVKPLMIVLQESYSRCTRALRRRRRWTGRRR